MDQTKVASKAASAVRSKARSAIRSVAVSSLMLRKQLWIWPILAALLLAICGWWVSRAVETAMRERREGELSTILNADVGALRVWMNQQATYADLIADDPPLVPLAQQLLATSQKSGQSSRELLQSPVQTELRTYLKQDMERCGFIGYFLVSPAGVVIAADQDAVIGQQLNSYRRDFFDKVFLGKELVSKPYRSTFPLADEHGELKPNLPTMLAAAPVRNDQGEPIAVLGLRIRPEVDFTRILQTARSGESGETYAFDDHGLFLSESRFDEQLKEIGLLADAADHHSVLTLELRDPQVDMTKGLRPAERRANLPFTKMAASAVRGETGADVVGYRDYRGVPVVGAWTWLKDYDFGVATEQDVAESFRPLYILRAAFWGMFGLLVVASAAIFVFSIFVALANRKARHAALEARQLGQYKLDQKLGEGGMGVVYRAHHQMLQRPTAVKLLSLEKTNEQTLARFEREVQLTSKLNHPNTIAIYDYGRTPEGVFYYAMEYLEGINLEELVANHGPQPDGRVIYILQQVCGSLTEAHAVGLIHRDIKPANIFLTERGRMHSSDPAARDGKIRSHFFPGANTGVPVAVQDKEHLAINESFLKSNKMRVDIFAASPVTSVAENQPLMPSLSTMFATGEEAEEKLPRYSGGATPEPVFAPLDKAGHAFKPGEDVRIDVVVRTLALGHFFPAGTVDAFDAWLELKATDDSGRVIFWSGNLEGGNGAVDPGAHFYRSLQIDGEGNPINKRNAWASRATMYVNLIPPGAADVAHFLLRIPKDIRGGVHLQANLNYRKFTWYYTHFAFEGKPQTPDLPVVVLASAEMNLPVGSGKELSDPPANERDAGRWNDYGIGLFRQGDFTGAIRAFQEVTKITPKYVDGWVNVARVLIEEGETAEAKKWLAEAFRLEPGLGRAHFFQGLALKADGDYDGALREFETVAAQYPRDRVTLNQAGRMHFLKRDYKTAVEWFKRTVAIDPEDVSAHYNLMLCYRGLNDVEASALEEKLYLRFKADETAQTRTGDYRRDHPIDNNERQPIHLHEGKR